MRSARFWGAAIWGGVAAMALCAPGIAASRDRQALPQPSMRIPVEPMGYRPPGHLYLLARYSSSSLDFLDEKHLLLTFRSPRLLKRQQGSDGLDQVVHAAVLEIPEGRVVAEDEWLLHDRDRYVWPLGDGKAMIRIGDRLYETGPNLKREPLYASPSPLRMVQTSPDGELLVMESQEERHTPEQHEMLSTKAARLGSAPPPEDVSIQIARLDEKRMIMKGKADQVGDLPAISSGFLTQQQVNDVQWAIRFHGYDTHAAEPGRVVTEVPSTCAPSEKFLNEQSFLVLTCPPKHNDRFVAAYDLQGHSLWDGRWQSNFTWPAFRMSRNGASVAISWLAVDRPVSPNEPVDDSEVQNQVITVLDAHSGALRTGMTVSPIVSAGGNFALSPDGDRLAVLNKGAVELYELPHPPGVPPPNQRAAK